MARQVAWTEVALRDLERVAEYVSEDSPSYAAGLVRRISSRAGSLGDLAERGRVVPELGDQAVRELVIGSYRLIYEVGDQAVHVLALIHGARDLGAIWHDDPPDRIE